MGMRVQKKEREVQERKSWKEEQRLETKEPERRDSV